MTSSATASEAEVGTEVATRPRATGFAEWNRYAAVNDEFVPIHMDDEAGRLAGYPHAIAMGRLGWSYVHEMLRAWIGDAGRIRAVTMQFRAPMLKDAIIVCRGRVTGIRCGDGERVIDCEVWIEDDEGSVLAPGTATVVVPTT